MLGTLYTINFGNQNLKPVGQSFQKTYDTWSRDGPSNLLGLGAGDGYTNTHLEKNDLML